MSERRDPFSKLMLTGQEQQGYFTTKQAIEAGYADNTHPYHVRAGNWERVHRGIYRLVHLSPPEDGPTPAWLLWTRGRDGKPAGVLSHETALSYFDLGDFNPAKAHITVPVGFRRNSQPPKASVLHRAALAPARSRFYVECGFADRPAPSAMWSRKNPSPRKSVGSRPKRRVAVG